MEYKERHIWCGGELSLRNGHLRKVSIPLAFVTAESARAEEQNKQFNRISRSYVQGTCERETVTPADLRNRRVEGVWSEMKVFNLGHIKKPGIIVHLCSCFIKTPLDQVHLHTFASHCCIIGKQLTEKLGPNRKVICHYLEERAFNN